MSELAVAVMGLMLVAFGFFGRKQAPFSSWGMSGVGIALIVVATVALLDGPA